MLRVAHSLTLIASLDLISYLHPFGLNLVIIFLKGELDYLKGDVFDYTQIEKCRLDRVAPISYKHWHLLKD